MGQITLATDYYKITGTKKELMDLTDLQLEIAQAQTEGRDATLLKASLETLAHAHLEDSPEFQEALAKEERVYARIQEVHTVLATGRPRGMEGLTWMLLRSTKYRKLTEAQLCCLLYGKKTKLPKRGRRAMQYPESEIDSVGYKPGEPGPRFESQDRLSPPDTAGVAQELLALQFLHWEIPMSGLRWAAYTMPNGQGITNPTPGALGDILDTCSRVERRHKGGLAYYRLAG